MSLGTRSPHHSVKVLPATPTAGTFPSNIRVVRQTPAAFNEGVWGTPNAGGLVFAKRKKNVFKGPMLNVNSSPIGPGEGRSRAGSHSRSASAAGRRSGELVIQEEDEDDVEEVDAFSPISGPGEVEQIFPAPVEKAGEEGAQRDEM